MLYCKIICGNVKGLHEDSSWTSTGGMTWQHENYKLEKGYHSVLATGHGMNGTEETAVYRYGQAQPSYVITLK